MSKEKQNRHPVLKTVGAAAVTGAAAYGTYAWYIFTQAFNPDKSRYHPDGAR